MPVIAPESDRPRRFDEVDVLGRRREAVIVELHRLEPVVGATVILGKAVPDHWLQRLDGGFDAGKAAFGAIQRADDRMDVRVDQAWQHQFAAEVDDLGAASDQGRHVRVGADSDDGVAFEGDGLPDRARLVGRVDLAVAENDISLGGPCGGRPKTRDHHGETGPDQSSRNRPTRTHRSPFACYFRPQAGRPSPR